MYILYVDTQKPAYIYLVKVDWGLLSGLSLIVRLEERLLRYRTVFVAAFLFTYFPDCSTMLRRFFIYRVDQKSWRVRKKNLL